MKPSDILLLADAALTTLPLAMLAAREDSARWLAIQSTAATLLWQLPRIAADTNLRDELRREAARLEALLRPIQRDSNEGFERTQNLAAA
jgi:hypothetical protein